LAGRIDGCSAQQRRLKFERVTETRGDGAERAHRFGGDLGADSVAGENRD
jgi:hypothetical protein